MVICIVALVVFSIMGIFSIGYRKLAKEAFDCTFRMITFRPCRSTLDERIRARLTSKLMKTPPLAKFIYKNFKTLSWMFVIIFFASLGYSSHGIYNLIVHGTCTPGSDNCPFATDDPVCGCEEICHCGEDNCTSPDYKACKGNCTCQKEVCGIKE
jgi:hypothetical protein